LVIRLVQHDLESGERVTLLDDCQSMPRKLVYSPDGQLLALSTDMGGVKVYDGRNRKWLHSTPLRGSDVETQWDLAFSPDGQRLAAVSRTQVHVWDVRTGHTVVVLRGAPPRHRDGGFNPHVVWSPDGQRLVANNWNHTVSTWTAADRATPEAKRSLHKAALERRKK
jgi:WD40 repeat protein